MRRDDLNQLQVQQERRLRAKRDDRVQLQLQRERQLRAKRV